MATVHVSDFEEFLTAAAVSGDTIVLPSQAVWDFNEIAPEGYIGDIPINCAQIEGNGTAFQNLHLFGKFVVPSDCTFNDIAMKNTVCEGQSFFGISGGSRKLTMNGCIMTGIFGTETQNFSASRLEMNRSVLNIDMTQGSYSDVEIAAFGQYDAQYSRITVRYPLNSGGGFSFGERVSFCKYDIDYLGCRYIDTSSISGSVVVGNFGEAIDQNYYGSHGTWVTIFDVAAFSPNFVPGTEYFKGVTRQQMYDAAYLSSIGFPIGV